MDGLPKEIEELEKSYSKDPLTVIMELQETIKYEELRINQLYDSWTSIRDVKTLSQKLEELEFFRKKEIHISNLKKVLSDLMSR